MSQVTANDLKSNRILSALPESESRRILPLLERVANHPGEILYKPGDVLDCIYFPQRAVVSLLIALQDGETVEAGIVGSEGAIGAEAVLGAVTMNTLAVVHAPDGLLRFRRADLDSAFPRGSALWDHLIEFSRRLLLQAGQIAACNRIHRLEQRLCRWLLCVHDRSEMTEIPVTHEVLSHILGTPRSEVTLAAGSLRRTAAVNYDRGRLIILETKKLKAVACECYEVLASLAN